MEVTSPAGKTYKYGDDRYVDSSRKDDRRNGNSEKKKGWQVAEMWDKHHEIARLLTLGHTNIEVAEKLGITKQQVSNVKNSPVVQDRLTIMRAARDCDVIDLGKEIMKLAPIALLRIKEALTEGTTLGKEASASQILKEANGMLDRDMGKAIQRVDTRSTHMQLTVEDIERIQARAAELAMESGQLGED